MTIDHVNSEMLWLENTLQSYLKKMLAVKDDKMSQIGIPITLLHNKILKGGITACYKTWLYEYP